MKKTITLELLHQDLRVIKNESAELIEEDIKHFIQSCARSLQEASKNRSTRSLQKYVIFQKAPLLGL